MAQLRLNKFLYKQGLECRRRMWELARATFVRDEGIQLRLEEGREIGVLARELFPSGELVSESSWSLAVEKTKELIEKRHPAIFEAALEENGIRTRIDILEYAGGDLWNLIEVKSKKRIDKAALKKFRQDLVLQLYVADSQIVLSRIKVMHLSGLPRDPLEDFFADTDFTSEKEEILAHFEMQREGLVHDLNSETEPKPIFASHCKHCDFQETCWPDLPEYNILSVPIHHATKKKMIDSGIKKIEEIDTENLKEKPARFIRSYKTQAPVIDTPGLKSLMSHLVFPIYYLDFESLNPRVPLFDNMQPSEHFVFQYSIHREIEDGTIEHFDFLEPDISDPRKALALKLLSDLGESGSIVSHHAQFEIKQIESMARWLPDLAPKLLALKERFWDTENAFKNALYVDFRMNGSTSIKAVLPVLTGISYQGLDIQDGTNAQAAYKDLYDHEEIDDEKLRQLKEYCKMDTWAMVKIVEKLREVCEAE